MDRFDRQRRIAGWNQDRLQRCRVLVYGRGWLGTFTVWGLASLGIGEILWVGPPDASTDRLARWLLANSFQASLVHDYPVDVQYGDELAWIAAGQMIDAVLSCAQEPGAHHLCAGYAGGERALFRSATAAAGGWIGNAPPGGIGTHVEHPVTAMLAAALLVDTVREAAVPLRGGRCASGFLNVDPPAACRVERCLLVGVGGIGVYTATLAAALGLPIYLIDDDRVDTTNLNRQGLFSPDDAMRGQWKAHAARDALRRVFPRAPLSADPVRAEAQSVHELILANRISIVLSAVDNAATRLVLSGAGRDCGVPVVQGGTDVFAADVYVQEPARAPLDVQMRGALTRGREDEAAGRPGRAGGCAGDPSYVVPGMIAGALLMHRALQLSELYRGLRPIHWRAGDRPVEETEMSHVFDVPAHI